MEVALLGHYVRSAASSTPRFEPADFVQLYATLGRAARHENPRHFRPARPPRRQAAIPPSHPAGMGLSATLAGASGAGDAAGLVQPQRAGAGRCARTAGILRKSSMADRSPHRHGARRRPWRAHAAADRQDAEAARSGRRQAADRPCARSARSGGRRARGRQRALSRRPDRRPSEGPDAGRRSSSPTSAATCSTPAAAWSRRCRDRRASRSSTSIPTPSGSTA